MRSIRWSLVSLVLLGAAPAALANPAYFMQFKATYPAATALFNCKTCHDGGPPKLNPYGIDFQKAGHNFKAVESLDSDGDGFTNIEEITAGTNPGDKNSHPASH